MNPIPRVSGFRITSPLLSGIVWSIIWLGAGTLLLSLLLYSSSLSESNILPWVYGTHGAASLAGGFTSARRSGKRGWYIGAMTGLLYVVLVILTGFLSQNIDWSSRIPLLAIVALFAGAFGGMLGVNTGSAGSSGGKR
ncbi:TIGR04086 family membrane protein [Cohnella sp. REN36]|uniref:TIGR04086 family membrane protein n=1 Tax=Cohnella sp. REN36 TaxID=2887347 RepID=UPI001D148478|nr:TIGR04086 family membrane protein [Cohnella sp. REN36]MCC3376935.1 TIGR04086 family membrane protein [Cohnella sp. REN36]